MNEQLTRLEEKILNDIVLPSISPEYRGNLGGETTRAQDLDFIKLLKNIRRFYESNGGRNWETIVRNHLVE